MILSYGVIYFLCSFLFSIDKEIWDPGLRISWELTLFKSQMQFISQGFAHFLFCSFQPSNHFPTSCLAPPPDEALLGSKDGWDMLSVKIWWWGWESDPSEKFSIISASYGCNQEINSNFLEGLALELSLAGWPQMEEFGGIGWDAFRDWEIWGMPGFSEGHHNYYHSAVAVYRYIILFSPYNTKWHFFRQWREWVAAPAPPAT